MISPVHKYIKNYADAGADIITIHPEATENLEETIKLIKKFKKKVGVSLNPETSLNKLDKILDQIDLVLIMSVNPGFAGQQFIEHTLQKIEKLRSIIDKKKLKVEIEVDGGINFENSKPVIKAGADILVSGTTIFKSNNGNIKKNIEILRNY
jgi:ribulose-phosphate 3-epimerase